MKRTRELFVVTAREGLMKWIGVDTRGAGTTSPGDGAIPRNSDWAQYWTEWGRKQTALLWTGLRGIARFAHVRSYALATSLGARESGESRRYLEKYGNNAPPL